MPGSNGRRASYRRDGGGDEAREASREGGARSGGKKQSLRIYGRPNEDYRRHRITRRAVEAMDGFQEVILLDTHVVVWLASDPAKLSRTASDAIREASREGGTAISAITLWELAWLMTNGRLDISGTVEAFVEEIAARMAVRPITAKVAVLANQFPPSYPGDPCDRLIGATALAEGMRLVTKDRNIRSSKQVKTIW